jgi:hypothetical protein
MRWRSLHKLHRGIQYTDEKGRQNYVNENADQFRVSDVISDKAICSSVWIITSCKNLIYLHFCSGLAMIRLPDGIVTVHLDGDRYRGAYYFNGDEIVVTAYGLQEASADMAVLAGERGKAALNLAKLVLIDMVRDVVGVHNLHPGLSLQGSTTQIWF